MKASNQPIVLGADLASFHHHLRKQGTPEAEQHQSLVSMLNDAGIHHWQNGTIGEAVLCFKRAWNNMRRGPLLTSTCPEKNLGDSVSSMQREIVISKEPKTDKALYVYQRDEYDEGMHAYSLPIHIENDCMDDTIASGL